MNKTQENIRLNLSKLFNKSKNLMIKDKVNIQYKIKKLQHKKTEITDKDFNYIQELVSKALQKIENRKASLPNPQLNEDLPINQKASEIIDAIKENQVVIIAGETGSGKTTQIPKLCLKAGQGIKGDIACTQPRRIAAVSVAERIAEELNENLGQTTGYKIRFKDTTSADTKIKIMTDGILLAETLNDRFLNTYDTIIIDEAHERSLNIDFILGFLHKLTKKRKDLKIVITSATIDTEKFSKAFDNAPIIEVSGRTYPVETIYLPFTPGEDDEEPDLAKLACDAVDLLTDDYNSDILIFMPTENDILETIEKLKGRDDKRSVILPLYARLPSHMQKQVFKPVSQRKIVVTTNVAETSITIPGIKYVIDTGLARIPRYIPSSRTTSLLVSPISKSSADQRKGRCGRVSNGICIRLFSEEDYEQRPKFTLPEILRSNLADVLLKMTALKLGDIKNFPFIDKPESKNINDGYSLLTELGAIEETASQGIYKLTNIGQSLSKIPLDPKLARMLIEASSRGCLKEVTAIVSGLTAGDPKEYPEDKKQQAEAAHKIFKDPLSDFISILNIWEKFNKEHNNKLTTGAIGKFSKKYFLSFRKLKEWRDLYSQIKDILDEEDIKNQTKISENADKNDKTSPLYQSIHKSILTGYLSNIAYKTEKYFYKATKNRDVMLFPGSGLFKNPPDWIVAAEIVETSRLFARTAGYIEPQWIAEIAGPLCKETVYDPHYEKNQGRVVAFVQKALYGIIITAGTKVSYDKYNQDDAARIFFAQALITGEVKDRLKFLDHNKKIEKEITQLEEKLRKRDILVSENEIISFYESKIPGVSNIRTLKNIIRKKGDKFLMMEKQDLMNYDPQQEINSKFPNFIKIGHEQFKAKYKFNPGKEDDGITISVPANKALVVSNSSLDTAVPGIIDEKIEAILRGLPKKYRTMLNPVKEKANIISKEMKFSSQPIALSLSEFIKNRFSILIPPKIISQVQLPDHLNMRIELTDIKGSKIKVSRDPQILKNINISDLPDSDYTTKFKKDYEKKEIAFFETIEEIAEVYPGKPNTPVFYPAYEVCEKSICLKLFNNKRDADIAHMESVKEFYKKEFSTEIKNLRKTVKIKTIDNEVFSFFEKKEDVEKGILESVINEIFFKNIKTETEFESYKNEVKEKRFLNFLTLEKKEAVETTLKEYLNIRKFLSGLQMKYSNTKLIYELISDCIKNAKSIVPSHFYKLYTIEEMENLPRYLKAIEIRAQRGISNPAKDSEKNNKVKKFEQRLQILLDELNEVSSPEKKKETESFFWDIEEFKISLFAQEIKTKYKISEKKLEKKFTDISKMI